MVERRTPNPDAGGSIPSWPANLDRGMERLKRFFLEVRAEMRKVTWSGYKEVRAGAIAVLVLSGIVALFLWFVDFGLSQLVRVVLG